MSMMYYISISLVCSFVPNVPGQVVNIDRPRSLNVAGKLIKLPIKISFVSDITCNQTLGMSCAGSAPYTLGIGYKSINSIPLVLKAIDDKPELWPFHNMTIAVLNNQGYYKYSIRNTISAVQDNDTLAIFGLEATCDTEAMIAGGSNKLLISHYCTTPVHYPTFVQLQGSVTQMASAAASFIQERGWDRVVVVYFQANSVGAAEMASVYKRLNTVLLEQNIKNVKSYIIPTMTDSGAPLQNNYSPQRRGNLMATRVIKESYLYTRVYILINSTPFGEDIAWFLDIMSRMGLLQTGEYVALNLFPRILTSSYNGSMETSQLLLRSPLPASPFRNILREEIYNYYRSVAMFTETVPRPSDALRQFQTNSWNYGQTYKNKPPCPPLCNVAAFSTSNPSGVPAYAAGLYDAILYYASLVTKLIEQNNTDITDGAAMKQYFYDLRLTNTNSGLPLELDGFATSVESVTVSTATVGQNGLAGIYGIGTYSISSTQTLPNLKLDHNKTFNWPNGQPPPAGPRCGFTGETCPLYVPTKTWLIALFLFVGAALLIGFGVYYWRQKQYEKLLKQAIWKVLLQDLVLHDLNTQAQSRTSFGSAASMGSTATMRMHKSRQSLRDFEREMDQQSDIEEEVDPNIDEKEPLTGKLRRFDLIRKSMRNRRGGQDTWGKVGSFATALHKGRLVALKRVYKKSTTLSEEVIREIMEMTAIAHDNLNNFIGIVHEPAGVFVVLEFCQKGSLKDMLENDEIKLDRIFLSSIVFDILNGIQYLQSSSLRCHGRLKSSNCLIDSKWVLQLSDFGLTKFLNDEEKPISQEEKCRKLLWTPPELLKSDFNSGTPESDVYAFGIILHEIFGRQGPFGDTLLDPISTIERVKHPKADEPLCRPDPRVVIDAPDFVRAAMQECWDENSTRRPKVSDLQRKLAPLRKGLSDNMIDNIMSMIEKYNTNLEDLVSERTTQLELEKQKADALLSAMLPKRVAELLKQGTTVEPEFFETVTIYFSDIVGFANIIFQYTPFQVINFLHHMYATFDSILYKFDVYKVETIGDSYMVVSGLPVRNGCDHAGEIASMALHFLKLAKDGKFKTPSSEIVQLRIGIHSGPCVAGVVGLKMPRYCLFGDTVNTASRMESNGQALKIHCSGECNYNLKRLGGYETTERGFVTMKGKGEKLTYWLVDEDQSVRQSRIKEKQK